MQGEDALPGDTDALAARSLVANRVITLDRLGTLADWHRSFARVGRPQYAVAAEAVRAMQARVGEAALVAALRAVGTGTPFAEAYGAQGVGTLSSFMAEFQLQEESAGIAVSAAASAEGDLRWTIYSFAPNAPVRVRISGGRGYDLTFTDR